MGEGEGPTIHQPRGEWNFELDTIMKTLALLPAVCGTLCLFTACEVGEDYGGSRVSSLTVDAPEDYYGDYDEYTPYYSYEGRRYYRHGGRYVYYSDRRPSYVATLPARATYITPSRRGVKTTTVITRHHRDDDDDDDRDDRD